MATSHANSTACGAIARVRPRTVARPRRDTAAATTSTSAMTSTASTTSVNTRKKLVASSTLGTSAHGGLAREHGFVGGAQLHADGHLPVARVGNVEERRVVMAGAELLERDRERREVLN